MKLTDFDQEINGAASESNGARSNCRAQPTLSAANRRGTSSLKWDHCPDPDVLPLWVADMDFRTAPCIIEALHHRVEHGVFGYVEVPQSYYDSVISWFSRRHGWLMRRDWILYTTGVVPAISAIVQAVTRPGDKVLVQTPVYNCFFSSIRNNQCHVVENRLLRDGDSYLMDFDDLEQKTSDPEVKAMILCNPHNPAGRVWTREELQRLGDICLKNNVFVISDENHNELVMPGYTYTPYGQLGEAYLQHSAVCTSPSKSFNLAGLRIANITVLDPAMRQRIDKSININEVCDVSPFGVDALQAAYSPEGEQWLDGLIAYLYANYQFLLAFFRERLPQLRVTRLEGTYLVWVDCTALGIPSSRLEQELLTHAKVWFNSGNVYGSWGGEFLRINIACTHRTLEQALTAFADYVNS